MRKKNFTRGQVQRIKENLINSKRLRDLVMFCAGVDTCLRTCDLRSLKVENILDGRGEVLKRFTVRMQKTKLNVTVQLQEDTRLYLKIWIKTTERKGEDYLFTGERKSYDKKLSGMQHSRLVKKWAEELDLDPSQYSTHSMRRTRPAHIFEISKNLEYCRIILGHSSLASTQCYLGIDEGQALNYSDSIQM